VWRLHATRRSSSSQSFSPAAHVLGAERGIEASAIGILLTIRGVASMTSRLFLGRLTALIGRRKLLITGTLVAAVALAGASLPVSVAIITILMSLAGLGLGVGQPITMSWLAAPRPPVHAVVRCHCAGGQQGRPGRAAKPCRRTRGRDRSGWCPLRHRSRTRRDRPSSPQSPWTSPEPRSLTLTR
jgi:Major Facilitator Superfamily